MTRRYHEIDLLLTAGTWTPQGLWGLFAMSPNSLETALELVAPFVARERKKCVYEMGKTRAIDKRRTSAPAPV